MEDFAKLFKTKYGQLLCYCAQDVETDKYIIHNKVAGEDVLLDAQMAFDDEAARDRRFGQIDQVAAEILAASLHKAIGDFDNGAIDQDTADDIGSAAHTAFGIE